MLSMVEVDDSLESLALEPLAASAEKLDVGAVKRVCSAVHYASHLSNPMSNEDLRVVLDLEDTDSQTLAAHFERLCDSFWTRREDPLYKQFQVSMEQWDDTASSSSSKKKRRSSDASLVGATPSFFLPQDWECASALQKIIARETLPPSKHVLCNRLSFANHQELLALERLRVEVQCRIMNSVLQSGSGSDDEQSRHHHGAGSSLFTTGGCWVRDVASAKRALSVRACTMGNLALSNLSWPVLARVHEEDAGDNDDA